MSSSGNVLCRILTGCGVILLALHGSLRAAAADDDLVIYGGTSAGVIAAVQAAKMGKSVVLVEPGSPRGGMTSGGLGAIEVGNPASIGGLTREYFHRVWQYYQLTNATRSGNGRRNA